MTNTMEVFSPGEFIREELESRDWTQTDFADIMGRPVETINRIVGGKLAVTPETARGLAAAFGTSAELWLNLESAYQLSQVRQDDDGVARRAQIYRCAPIKDMTKRKWIASSSDIDVMERQYTDFFEIANVTDEPSIQVAARKSTDYRQETPAQIAWYFRAKHLAEEMRPTTTYKMSALKSALGDLRVMASDPKEVRRVPELLSDLGIRFVVVQQLPKSKIDGASFWLDKKNPVVAMSLRYDRIDCFWHTLVHELSHVIHNDRFSIDENMVGAAEDDWNGKPDFEKRADEFAATTLIPREELDDFIVRVRPLYGKKKIRGFAARLGIHPGIVVGQLQHRREIGYSHSRDMLEKIREIIIPSATTDGWGIFS